MCLCDPRIRTPWCGKPGCEMPVQRRPKYHNRPHVDVWCMELARAVSLRSSCLKRAVGAVLAKDGRVVSTGYNGTPSGYPNCGDGGCPRCAEDSPAGEDYARCMCCHAEENAIVQAARYGVAIEGGATLYTLLSPCVPCARKIVNAGIIRVVFFELWDEGRPALDLLNECGVTYEHLYGGTENGKATR